MTATERQPIRWLTQSKDFHRSSDGRFDLIYTNCGPFWAVYDFDRPHRHVAGTLAAAKAWCEQRITQTEGK
jgi:hypothetical protein